MSHSGPVDAAGTGHPGMTTHYGSSLARGESPGSELPIGSARRTVRRCLVDDVSPTGRVPAQCMWVSTAADDTKHAQMA